MQLMGIITIHPQTYPIADEVAHTAVMLARLINAVYGLTLRPSVEELYIVIKYS